MKFSISSFLLFLPPTDAHSSQLFARKKLQTCWKHLLYITVQFIKFCNSLFFTFYHSVSSTLIGALVTFINNNGSDIWQHFILPSTHQYNIYKPLLWSSSPWTIRSMCSICCLFTLRPPVSVQYIKTKYELCSDINRLVPQADMKNTEKKACTPTYTHAYTHSHKQTYIQSKIIDCLHIT